MKICPKCGTTYTDETLNFCLEDGSVLDRSDASSEPPPTVMMSDPTPPTADQAIRPTVQQTAPVQQYTMPQKKSRTWIWVVLALFAVVIVCGGGFVGLVAIGSLSADEDKPPSLEDSTSTRKPDNAPGKREVVNREDMSEWPDVLSRFDGLKVDYRGGELFISTRRNFFYVISTGDQFKTWDSTVKVNVRNPSGRATNFGYGLIVHSDPSQVLKRDYAFVIRSDTGKYRVVEHVNKEETVIVSWTDSDAIRRGSRSNSLEVRCDGNKMHFYVNDEFVRTVTDYSDYEDGVAGLYTSDDVPIAFSDLELRR